MAHPVERPVCETWADHAWSGERIVGGGNHPTMGSYIQYERACSRCARKQRETRWTGPRNMPVVAEGNAAE